MNFKRISCNSFHLQISEEINDQVLAKLININNRLEEKLENHIDEIVPAYNSILITSKLDNVSVAKTAEVLEKICKDNIDELIPKNESSRIIEVPVYYDPEVAYDLEELSSEINIPIDLIIKEHTKPTYKCYAIGFVVGFGYLATLPDVLVCDRLKKPRRNVPAGSVGLAKDQTAVYPIDSPGGWRVIGRTPLSFIEQKSADNEFISIKVGDQVKFHPISKADFLEFGGKL